MFADDALIPIVPDPVIVPPVIGEVVTIEVTVPVVDEVPAPMAVLKVAASSAEIVLSAFSLGNVIADGLIRVNRFPPTVVAPKEVLAVAATRLVLPPSHCNLWVYAESQFV